MRRSAELYFFHDRLIFSDTGVLVRRHSDALCDFRFRLSALSVGRSVSADLIAQCAGCTGNSHTTPALLLRLRIGLLHNTDEEYALTTRFTHLRRRCI